MRYFNYIYIFLTILFTVYGQLVIKWRITKYSTLPEAFIQKLIFLANILLDPFIFSGFLAAFLASLSWMIAMGKFNISHAYPFMALNFVFVLILSSWLLNETLSLTQVLGVSIIVLGTIVASNG